MTNIRTTEIHNKKHENTKNNKRKYIMQKSINNKQNDKSTCTIKLNKRKKLQNSTLNAPQQKTIANIL